MIDYLIPAIFPALLLLGGVQYQLEQEQHVTDQEFVVIYNLTRPAGDREPLTNVRVVIRAKSDGEAVMKSVIHLQATFGVNATERLEFVEVAARREEKKK